VIQAAPERGTEPPTQARGLHRLAINASCERGGLSAWLICWRRTEVRCHSWTKVLAKELSLSFHRLDLLAPSRQIETLLAAVEADRSGIFWGGSFDQTKAKQSDVVIELPSEVIGFHGRATRPFPICWRAPSARATSTSSGSARASTSDRTRPGEPRLGPSIASATMPLWSRPG
jgi:hypothetical protein